MIGVNAASLIAITDNVRAYSGGAARIEKTGRSRQLATRDSPFVHVGEDRRIAVDLDPPAGAIAYRVRVLGRLVTGALRSRVDAIHVQPLATAAERGGQRPSLTRLETDVP